MRRRHAALHGLRTLLHALVVTIHTLAYRTLLVDQGGTLHRALTRSMYNSIVNFGGAASVDGFFIVAGFCLVQSMLELEGEGDVWGFMIRFVPMRYLRLAILISLHLAFVMGLGLETVSPQQAIDILLLSGNMELFAPRMKSSLSYLWSANADFWQQCFLASLLCCCVNLWGSLAQNKRLATVVLVLVALFSVVRRAVIFDPRTANYLMLARGDYFADAVDSQDVQELAKRYNLTLRGAGPGGVGAGQANDFYSSFIWLYSAPMARIAPMALGGIVALWVDSPASGTSTKLHTKSWLPKLGFFSSMSFLLLATIPLDRDEFSRSWAIQWFASVLSHVYFSLPMSVLLYCVVVEPSSPWHANMATRFFSMPFWQPLAEATYSSYVIHPVVLSWVNYSIVRRQNDYDDFADISRAVDAFYFDVVKGALLTVALSLAVGWLLTTFVHRRLICLVQRRISAEKPKGKAE